jgi:chromosome partitioning protein
MPTCPACGQGFLLREKAVRKLLVASQKSGVGKTTTSMNLAAAAARKGTRVLLLDADPLSNVSTALNLAEHPNRRPLRQAGIELPGVLVPNFVPGLDILSPYDEGRCSDDDLDRLLQALTTPMARHCYGSIVVDSPPFLGANPAQLVGSCDEFLLVMRAEATAYRTLPAFQELVQRSGRNGHSIQMRGILLTLALGDDPGCRWERELRGRFGARILPEVIPHDETIDNALRSGQIGSSLHPDSAAARQFRQLAAKLGLTEESCAAATAEKVTQALRDAAAEVGPALVPAPEPATVPAPEPPIESGREDLTPRLPAAAPEPVKPAAPPILRPRRLGRSGEIIRPARSERVTPTGSPPVRPSGRLKKVAANAPPPEEPSTPPASPPLPAQAAAGNALGQLWPLWILLGAVLGGGLRFLPTFSAQLPLLVGLGVAVIAVLLLRGLPVGQDAAASASSDKTRVRARPRDHKKVVARPEAKKDAVARLASLTNGMPKSARRDPNPN